MLFISPVGGFVGSRVGDDVGGDMVTIVVIIGAVSVGSTVGVAVVGLGLTTEEAVGSTGFIQHSEKSTIHTTNTASIIVTAMIILLSEVFFRLGLLYGVFL